LTSPYIDIVFDGPPGPEPGRFIEVEDAKGNSIRFGEWIERKDGKWVLASSARICLRSWARSTIHAHKGKACLSRSTRRQLSAALRGGQRP
jgi:hypothetical protein